MKNTGRVENIEIVALLRISRIEKGQGRVGRKNLFMIWVMKREGAPHARRQRKTENSKYLRARSAR